MLDNTNRAIKKENLEILATFGTEDTRQRQRPLYANKHNTINKT